MAIHVGRVNSKGKSSTGGWTITETWQIVEDTGDGCAIGPTTCLIHADMPKLGMPYNPDGCDTTFNGLVVTDVDLSDLRFDDSKGHCWREASVLYKIDASTPGGVRPGMPNFNKPDPVSWLPLIEVNTATRRLVAEKLPFLGAYRLSQVDDSIDPCAAPDNITFYAISNTIVNRPKDSVAPVASSAGELFQPPEEIDSYDSHIRLTLFVEHWDEDDIYDCFRGSINDGDVILSLPHWNYEKSFSKHTLQIRDIQGKPSYKEWRDATGALIVRTYWSVVVDIIHRKAGHYIDKLNVGTVRIMKGSTTGLSDGHGGLFDNTADFPAGTSGVGDILDANRRPITTPVWINLDGQPVADGDVTNQWGLRYVTGHLKNFSDPLLGLPLGTP